MNARKLVKTIIVLYALIACIALYRGRSSFRPVPVVNNKTGEVIKEELTVTKKRQTPKALDIITSKEEVYGLLIGTAAHIPDDELHTIANAVVENAVSYDLDPKLVLGVMYAESSFRFWVTNKNSVGLMQINTKVWDKELRDKCIISSFGDYYRIDFNVEAGCYILSRYMKETSDLDSLLKRYSGGAKSAAYYANCKRFLEDD